MIVLVLLNLLFVFGSYAKPFNITADDNFGFYDYQGKIVGGRPASEGQFPYQAQLHKYTQYSCGGAIYTDRWIVTAAHCIVRVRPADVLVKVGSNRVPGHDGQLLGVVKLIPHPEFNGPPMYDVINDIGLVQTISPIVFNSRVQPIPLGIHQVGGGNDVVVSGFGKLEVGAPSSDILYYINLKTIDNDACGQHWPAIDHYLCTYTKHGEGTCHGDSGGPLVENGVLVGVVSFGKPCAIGVPDVFTRVSSFVDWIKSNTQSLNTNV